MTVDVAIVGGGIVGAALALALEDAHASVVLIGPQSAGSRGERDGWDSRIYTVSPGNADWLAALGIWQALPQGRLTRVEAMRVFGDDGAAELSFSAYDAGLRELAWTVENRVLHDALWTALQSAPHVELQRSARCADIAWGTDHALITLEDGREVTARLVIGADGADSWVRARAGISALSHGYAQLGVVANFTSERAHEETAFQWFRCDGVLALLPLPERRVSMVWSAPETRGRELMGMSPSALGAEVTAATREAVGRLDLIGTPVAFPLHRVRVERLAEPRVALVGDAAHNVHPLAGQGLNLGMRDARELASVLASRGPQRDCGDYALLRRYERARKEDILALDLTTDGLAKLFASGEVWLAKARNFGLALIDLQPQLKNLLVRQATA